MKKHSKAFYLVIVLLLAAGWYLYNQGGTAQGGSSEISATATIGMRTREATVIAYLRAQQRLPDYYLTKKQARARGWDPASGNLCDLLEGYAIGGDHFSNRERKLPAASGREWFEADLDYNCGRRNARRLLYSSDGLIYVSYDHYKTFQKR